MKKSIREVREKFPDLYMVTFKYEEKVSRKELVEITQSRIEEGYELVIGNRGEDMTPEGGYQGVIVDKNGVVMKPTSKNECAKMLLDLLEKA